MDQSFLFCSASEFEYAFNMNWSWIKANQTWLGECIIKFPQEVDYIAFDVGVSE